MSRFLAGFSLATVIWGGLLYAQATGIITLHLPGGEEDVADSGMPEIAAEADEAPDRVRKRRKKRLAAQRKSGLTGNAMTGDDLGGPGIRDLNAAEGGGEGQLRQSEVESGIDDAFPKIRRCLMLVDSDEPVRGRLVLGMRISGAGRVTKVNLSGPAVVTKAEAGGCIRQAVHGISYRTFDGPDMVVHYPITLE